MVLGVLDTVGVIVGQWWRWGIDFDYLGTDQLEYVVEESPAIALNLYAIDCLRSSKQAA